MTPSDCEIALATVDDIPGIVELQRLNLLSNGGFLSIEFSNDWFERVLSEMPIIVARRDGRVCGYLVSSSAVSRGGGTDRSGKTPSLSGLEKSVQSRSGLHRQGRAKPGTYF